jgi:hypothetical protein
MRSCHPFKSFGDYQETDCATFGLPEVAFSVFGVPGKNVYYEISNVKLLTPCGHSLSPSESARSLLKERNQ